MSGVPIEAHAACLQIEVARLRAEVARLERGRDEARAEAEQERHTLLVDGLRVGEHMVRLWREDLAAAQARVAALEAEVKRWEDKEVHRASCCWENEKRAKELEAALREIERRAALPITPKVSGLPSSEVECAAAVAEAARLTVAYVVEPARALLSPSPAAPSPVGERCATCGLALYPPDGRHCPRCGSPRALALPSPPATPTGPINVTLPALSPAQQVMADLTTMVARFEQYAIQAVKHEAAISVDHARQMAADLRSVRRDLDRACASPGATGGGGR